MEKSFDQLTIEELKKVKEDLKKRVSSDTDSVDLDLLKTFYQNSVKKSLEGNNSNQKGLLLG